MSSDEKITLAKLKQLAKEHPEWANGIAKLSPEYQLMQQRVSQAETAAEMGIEEGAIHANVNWTYNRYHEARAKFAPNFSTLLVSTIDEMYEISGRIKNLHRMVHPSTFTIPGWVILSGVFIFGLLALSATTPLGPAVAKLLAASSYGVPNIYPVSVLLLCVVGIIYLLTKRRSSGEAR